MRLPPRPAPASFLLSHDPHMKLARPRALALGLVAACGLALPAHARDALGMFGSWGAFRDAAIPRCYAIALPTPPKGEPAPAAYTAYADVSSWPKRSVRNQVHFRLSRRLLPGGEISLALGGQKFKLAGGGGDAWAADPRMDAAIVAAMRSAGTMTLSARDTAGKTFSASWALAGAASAMDSASLGCAQPR